MPLQVRFIKTNPTENMTLLLQSAIPREKQAEVAKKLIAYNSVYAEQAGFVEEPANPAAAARLQMMAGEFCGNATLSLAAYLFAKEQPVDGEKKIIPLEVSGAEEILVCEMQKIPTGFQGEISMPLPLSYGFRTYSLEGETYALFTVDFLGICHIIVPKSLWGEDAKEKAEQAAEAWENEISVDALGILLLEESRMELVPLVSVRGAGRVWERGCGSGTTAVGVYLAWQKKESVSAVLYQPGGEMGISVIYTEKGITKLMLTGKVSIVAEGVAYV